MLVCLVLCKFWKLELQNGKVVVLFQAQCKLKKSCGVELKFMKYVLILSLCRFFFFLYERSRDATHEMMQMRIKN